MRSFDQSESAFRLGITELKRKQILFGMIEKPIENPKEMLLKKPIEKSIKANKKANVMTRSKYLGLFS